MKKISLTKTEQLIFVTIVLVVISFLVFYFVYRPKSVERDQLKINYEEVNSKLSFDNSKTSLVPKLKEDLELAKSELATSLHGYYVDPTQERYAYLINKYIDESDLILNDISYSFDKEMEFNQALDKIKLTQASVAAEAAKANSDKNAKPAPTTAPELSTLEAFVTSARLNLTGNFKDVEDFVYKIGTNSEKININSISLTPILEVTDMPSIENFGGKVRADISLSFYVLPKGLEFITPEPITSWKYQNSTSNPFSIKNFDAIPYEKVKTFEINGSENITVTSVDTPKESQIQNIQNGERSYPAIYYYFDETMKDGKYYVNLENLNILINAEIEKEEGVIIDRIEKVGMLLYSDSLSKSRINLFIEDANKKPQTIELSQDIFWKDWASLKGSINPDMVFPIKIKQLEILQSEKGGIVEEGNILIDSIFAAGQVKGTTTLPFGKTTIDAVVEEEKKAAEEKNKPAVGN